MPQPHGGEPVTRTRRVTIPGARDDRLFFAQVREDPVLEIEALEPSRRRSIVVVSSGGCTALSLLAAGASQVTAVDLNTSQNHLVELKAGAVGVLDPADAIPFLGGWPASGEWRLATYRRLRDRLNPGAVGYWDARLSTLERGVLGAGVTERFIAAVVLAVRLAVHPPSRIRRLLACRTVEEQRALYEREWNNRRWRALFTLLLNKVVFRKTYDPSFFAHVDNPSFPKHFHALVEHALTQLPVADNYFVHHMLAGSYPVSLPTGVPPYLAAAGPNGVGAALGGLTLVDGAFTDHLRTRPDSSIDGFALSNICEWFDPAQIDELMAEIVRTAAPGARLVFRNFVGWTEVPDRWAAVVVEDRARGEELIKRDRSAVQRRIAVCDVVPAGTP